MLLVKISRQKYFIMYRDKMVNRVFENMSFIVILNVLTLEEIEKT